MDFEEKNIFEKSSLWRDFFQYIWTIFSFEKWTASFGMTLKNLNEILDLGKMQKKKKNQWNEYKNSMVKIQKINPKIRCGGLNGLRGLAAP